MRRSLNLAKRYLSMVEFPSMEHAKAWYDSPENAEARALTPAAFRGRLLIFVRTLNSSTREAIDTGFRYGILAATVLSS
jgi:hypothetical protein